jgi:phosphatidate cytidylyltransferase
MKPNKLKHRILTALLLTPLVIAAIFLLPPYGFALFASLVLWIAGWEWCRLSGYNQVREQCIYLALLTIIFWLVFFIPSVFIFSFAVFWWLCVLLLLFRYPTLQPTWLFTRKGKSLMGVFVLIPTTFALLQIRSVGAGYLLFAFFLVWSADTGAYAAGRIMGRHPLMSRVSPNKTIEGVIGGIVLALIIAVIGLYLLHVPTEKWPAMLILSLVVVMAAVVGDLFESMMKRIAGVKDSANWLPGHGGLLDRIDSITCALPIFALGTLILHL